MLHLLIELIVDVQVCVRELLDGRKRLLDCFIGLKPHGYGLEIRQLSRLRSRTKNYHIKGSVKGQSS